jgi:hypothetical protein
VGIPHRAKSDYFDDYDAEVTRPLPEPDGTTAGLADDFAFTATTLTWSAPLPGCPDRYPWYLSG